MTSPPTRAGLGILLMLVAMFAFAAMDAISKAVATTLPIPQIMWVRYAIFTVLALVMLHRLGIARIARSARPALQGGRAVVGVIENAVFVLAFTYLPLADVHAIAAASPLIVIALSVPLLGEHVGIRRWLAVAVGFIGVMLIIRPGFETLGPGHLVALAGAFLWAGYQLLVRKVSQHDHSETTLLWTAVVGLIVTSFFGPFFWVPPDAKDWALLAAIAVLGTGAHLAIINALSIASASALQPFGYTMLLWAAVIGFLAFGDIPDRWTIAGAGLILISGLYAWHRERVRSR